MGKEESDVISFWLDCYTLWLKKEEQVSSVVFCKIVLSMPENYDNSH